MSFFGDRIYRERCSLSINKWARRHTLKACRKTLYTERIFFSHKNVFFLSPRRNRNVFFFSLQQSQLVPRNRSEAVRFTVSVQRFSVYQGLCPGYRFIGFSLSFCCPVYPCFLVIAPEGKQVYRVRSLCYPIPGKRFSAYALLSTGFLVLLPY